MSDDEKLLNDEEQFLNDEEQPKRGVGRPKWIPDEERLKTVESLASQGMTNAQIADALGIAGGTLYEKINEYPEFYDAIKRGRAKGIAMVTSKLMQKIQAMDTASIFFYLKCQAGWKDTTSFEFGASGNQKVEIVINGGPPTSA
jgi:hypothetical protein